MIKCFFVNVKSIFCDVPRSNFVESELEQLADFILQTDGLIRPLILKEIGVQQYAVIRGHREYYGAVIAKERDLKKAEMVNAFIIEPEIQEIAIEQLNLLSENRESSFDRTIDMDKDRDVDRLLPALASIISHQLQPLTQQLSNITSELVKHKEMLALLTRDSPVAIPKVLEKEEKVIKLPLLEVVTLPAIVKPPTVEPKVILQRRGSANEIIQPAIIPPKKVKEKEKSAQIAPVGSEIALDLINRLSQTDLSLNMQQARIPSAVKLVTSIVSARNKQPDKKFDCWETFISEVKGLGPKTAQTIIDKLR
jgi:hypothetical protein